MKRYRHGDVIIIEVESIPADASKLQGVTLAEGEVTGHSHRITEGMASMFAFDSKTYLEIQSDLAMLSHEEHSALQLPKGNYEVIIQREYDDENEWRNVLD